MARDVRVIQRREHLRLALEPREPVRIGRERLGQHLDRDVAVQPRVARAIDLAHPAGADGDRISYGPRRVPGSSGMGSGVYFLGASGAPPPLAGLDELRSLAAAAGAHPASADWRQNLYRPSRVPGRRAVGADCSSTGPMAPTVKRF